MQIINLKSLQKKIEIIQRWKRRQPNRVFLYNNYNKDYKKLDWNKKRFSARQCVEALKNTSYKHHVKMLTHKQMRFIHLSDKLDDGYYRASQMQNLFLLQQIMSQIDSKFWDIRKITRKKKRKKKTKKTKKIRKTTVYFKSKYMRKKISLGRYTKEQLEKINKIKQFLKQKQFIFDKESQFYIKRQQIVNFVKTTLMYNVEQKWQFCFQRLIAQNI